MRWTPAGKRLPLRVVGVDALVVASIAPALMPVPGAMADRLAVLAPATVFLNPAAVTALAPANLPVRAGAVLRLQSALTLRNVTVAGTVNAGGAPLAVMDIGAAQDLFGAAGPAQPHRPAPAAGHGSRGVHRLAAIARRA